MRPASREFRFSGRYLLAAPPGPVIAALRAAERWPLWWPQVREVRRHDESWGTAYVRGLLPLTLAIEVHREIDEALMSAGVGVLQARLAGDLEGRLRFEVRPAHGRSTVRRGGGVEVSYEQHCRLARDDLARLLPYARPALVLNHAWTMRAGMRGLAGYAAGSGVSAEPDVG